MVPRKYISLLILSISMIWQTSGWTPFFIDFETIKYEINPKYLSNMNLQLIDYKGHRAINGSLTFAQELNRINTSAIGYIVNNNKINALLFNVTHDTCAFYTNYIRNAPYYVRTFLKELKTYLPNLPKKCPILKNQVIEVLHLYLDAEKFPSTLAEVDINATYFMVTGKERVFSVYATFYVALVNSKRYREKMAKYKK